ncbi:Zn-dependent protease [Herminiimonas sp. KBW02]|uniref:M48 family metallopeptidase n=1 Tax=Herminiimonas sp. KBW02 TaxID=2153363 RepID=UPI000F59EA57|nr:M48 family metallopeptidase [Herminiimonas sp. KBW02]RQO35953.1 Zn-dependent protease [Herminiimonas sp. KBW02]
MSIPALYFDGKTSRAHQVTLSVEGGHATISGEAERSCPISELRVSERARNTKRKVTFPDEAYLEIADTAAFDALLADTGHQDSLIVRMQQSWRGALTAVVATLIVLTLSYLYVLPLASEGIAKMLPEKVERSIGKGMLDFLDKQIFAPSQLPQARQEALIGQFRHLQPPRGDVPGYRILFRKSKIGPNAFALPSGEIIITDELVKLMKNDEQVMGVLAHELGHLHERHLMRRVVQSSAVAALATVVFGDASAIVANIPTLLLDMKYSRDAEREADDYAIAMMKANGIDLVHMAGGFEQLQAATKETTPPPYLSSHPSTDERIDHILKSR